jgi:hypothetical protein
MGLDPATLRVMIHYFSEATLQPQPQLIYYQGQSIMTGHPLNHVMSEDKLAGPCDDTADSDRNSSIIATCSSICK